MPGIKPIRASSPQSATPTAPLREGSQNQRCINDAGYRASAQQREQILLGEGRDGMAG